MSARAHRGMAGLAVACVIAMTGAPAQAGPPYVTDDPQPTDLGHWEVYAFTQAVRTPGLTEGAQGLDLNYGPIRDVQLTATLPVEFSREDGRTRHAFGDVEVAAKIRVLHQDAFGADVAVFPRLVLPTARGPGKVGILLPVWAQRDIGDWSLFGGGGYTVNPGPDARNFWQGGVALTRQVTPRLNLGLEIYHRGPDARDSAAFTGMNVGVDYQVAPHWSLIGAAGPGLQNTREGGRFAAYVALKAEY